MLSVQRFSWQFLLGLLLVQAPAMSPRSAESAEVTIGYAGPITGSYASTGARNMIAVISAVDQLNAEGGVLGHEVKLVTADDQCGMQEAITAAEELVEAGVVMVVGHTCSHASLLAAAIYEMADVIMITPNSTHWQLTEEGRPNVFRLTGRDDHQAETAVDLITTRWPGKRTAIIHDGRTYGRGLALTTQRGLRRRGHEIAWLDEYEADQTNFSALVDRLADDQIELLFVGGYGPDAGRIAAEAGARGLDLQLIGGDGLGMDSFWSAAQYHGLGALFTAAAAIEPAAGSEDVERYQQFDSGGLRAYAAVELWSKAAERAGSFAYQHLLRTLHQSRFKTLQGEVAFDRKGDLRDVRWGWRVWQDGRHTPVAVNRTDD